MKMGRGAIKMSRRLLNYTRKLLRMTESVDLMPWPILKDGVDNAIITDSNLGQKRPREGAEKEDGQQESGTGKKAKIIREAHILLSHTTYAKSSHSSTDEHC